MEHKIVIATPVDFSNYGNRLQNYAVHKICEEIGLKPVTLAVEYTFVKHILSKHLILKIISALKIDKIFSGVLLLKRLNKSIAAWNFTKKEIKTKYINNQKQLEKTLKNVEYFGIGGDQVLAPYWRNIIWFATFPEQKSERKICFAPSFGSERLPEDYLKNIMPEINLIAFPAVREQSGCTMIELYLGKKAQRICDPVVMLTKEEWKQSAEKYPVHVEKPYVLLYFLGDIKKDYIDYIKKEAKSKKCKIIDVSSKSLSSEAACNPMEFVSYIQSAKVVYTDSFHAIMLSLILHRSVVIFERVGGKEMNTRIAELIQRYKLDKCMFSEVENEKKLIGYYDIDYVNKVLKSERVAAYEYYNRIV